MRYIILPIFITWYVYGWIQTVKHFDQDWGKGYNKDKDNWRKHFLAFQFFLVLMGLAVIVIVAFIKFIGLLIRYW